MFFNNVLFRRALPQSKRLLSVSNSKAEFKGLLKGASQEFFTSDLDATEAFQLVQYSDVEFRSAITRDLQSSEWGDAAKYLKEIKKRASLYLTDDELCGRVDVCGDIEEAMLEKGNLVFVTGGRSVGKSKIVHSIVKKIGTAQSSSTGQPTNQPRVSMVVVDGRIKGDLVSALSAVATSESLSMARSAATTLLSAANFTYTSTTGEAYGFDMKAVKFASMSVDEAVGALASKHPQDTNHTVLILDEANDYLDCTGDRTATTHAKNLYKAVVSFTKQQNLMTVLLVSSDEGLPFHLQNLGVNRQHISHTLVINEPTPSECRDLLQNKFGVGEHLTNALLGCYGGNVYQMVKFLQLLPTAFRRKMPITMFKGPASDVGNAVVTWVTDGGEEIEIMQVLEELARTGFVPMLSANKLAQLLTKHNVCAFLTDNAVEYQVPPGLRAQREGLIPSSQMLRVLIPWKLQQIRENKQDKGKISEDKKAEVGK